jgi:hypothetical protein
LVVSALGTVPTAGDERLAIGDYSAKKRKKYKCLSNDRRAIVIYLVSAYLGNIHNASAIDVGNIRNVGRRDHFHYSDGQVHPERVV